MIRILTLLAALAAIGPRDLSAQTQADLTEDAMTRLRHADSTLNALYSQVVARYRADTAALRKLRTAERAWIAFRDAEVEATYPAKDKQAAYGSAVSMCIPLLLLELTEARIAQLRRALSEEGDLCSGGPV